MKYNWKHFWGSFEKKANAIFGEGEEKRPNDVADDPTFQKNIEELRGA